MSSYFIHMYNLSGHYHINENDKYEIIFKNTWKLLRSVGL